MKLIYCQAMNLETYKTCRLVKICMGGKTCKHMHGGKTCKHMHWCSIERFSRITSFYIAGMGRENDTDKYPVQIQIRLVVVDKPLNH